MKAPLTPILLPFFLIGPLPPAFAQNCRDGQVYNPDHGMCMPEEKTQGTSLGTTTPKGGEAKQPASGGHSEGGEHGEGDIDELLPFTPEDIAALESRKEWSGSYEKAHDRIHDLIKQIQERRLPEDEFLKQRKEIIASVNKILRAGVDFVEVESDRSLSPRARAFLYRRIESQMENAGHGLDAIKAPDGQSAHMVFMGKDGGLAPIMTAIKTAATHNPPGHWEDVVRGNRGNPNAWIGAGEEHLKNRDPRTAADDFSQALKLSPGNAAALSGRAMAHYDLKDYPAAAEDARAVLDIKPGDPAASAVLKFAEARGSGGAAPVAGQANPGPSGFAASGSGGDPALAPAGASANQSASNSSTRQAQMAMSLRDYQSAIGHAGRAIELNAMNAQAYNLRAIAYSRLGKYELALKDAEGGLRLDPKNGPLLDGKSYALNRMKRYREALAAADAALETDPKDAYAHRMRAMALAGLGDRRGMIEALRRAAALDPRNEAALQAALQLPEAGDLMFLFPEEDGGVAAGGVAAGAGAQRRRFNLIAAASVVGGFLIALGLLQWLIRPLANGLRTAYRRITGRSPAVSAPGPVATPAPFPAGRQNPSLLRGQYRILRQIGAGGMGLVYEGTDVSLERRVAIKKMRDELRFEAGLRRRFVTEAKLVAALRHPHIVDIYAIVEEGEDVYLVFEYVVGRTVHEIVAAEGRLGFPEAMGIFKGICLALDYAHGRGVIHRDLKPSNVMVSEAGCVKVMDFGIARLAKDAASRYSVTNTVVGTPPYMAPEQEQGVVRKESDVYSLAVCLYEMLCGKMPFNGTGAGMLMNKINKSFVPVSRMAEGLPSGLDAVLARALEPDPDKRFHGAKEFQAHLDALALARS